MGGVGTDTSYWTSYNALQATKHQVLRKYLQAWFPILASWSGKVLYIDCHAGRGRHTPGHEGSPIIALKALFDHQLRERILAHAEVTFIFFEVDGSNLAALESEVVPYRNRHEHVKIKTYCADYEKVLTAELDALQTRGFELAPAFAFLDPFGFDISMEFVNRILRFQGCEVFINLMYRYVDMAVHNDAQHENMVALFGTERYVELREMRDAPRRERATLDLYAEQLGAKYVTNTRMIGANEVTKYFLIHASNHEKGREVMKEAIWSVIPDGTFSAYQRDVVGQTCLIAGEPDLQALEEMLWDEFAGKSVETKALEARVRRTLYLGKHLHRVLRRLRQSGAVRCTGYSGRFAFQKNPVFLFAQGRPE